MSCIASQGHGLGQLFELAPDWLLTLAQLILRQLPTWLLIGCSLLCSQSGASLLGDTTVTMTTNQKFSSLVDVSHRPHRQTQRGRRGTFFLPRHFGDSGHFVAKHVLEGLLAQALLISLFRVLKARGLG